MEVLAKENEYALLLEQLRKHMEQVYHYGKILAEKYPADVCAIFAAQINKDAESAHTREMYREVCSHISLFAKAGYKAEVAKMRFLREEYG
jgi:hypothetical protein